MKHALYATASVAVLSLAAGTASADVTAQQVWESWQAMNAGSGQTYTVGKEETGDGSVTLTDVMIASTNERSKVTGTIPELMFKEQGDGTVAVTMTDAYDLAMTTTTEEGSVTTNTIGIAQGGMALIVSGTPEAMNYAYDADTVGFTVDDVVTDGKPSDLAVAVTVKDIAVVYDVTPGANAMDMDANLKAASVEFRASGTSPKAEDGAAGADLPDGTAAGGGTFDVSGSFLALAGASTGTIPTPAAKGSAASGDFAAMLAAGFTTDGSFSYDSSAIDATLTDAAGAISTISERTGTGKLNVSLDQRQIAYDVSGTGVTVEAKIANAPVSDATFGMAESRVALLFPLAKSDAPEPFGLNVTLRGLTLSDSIWALIDPQATIARTPANLVIDTKGTATPKVTMGDTAAMETMQGPPADLNSLEISELELTAGGASLKGTGAVAFDYAKPKVLGGALPMPTGKINLSLNGANELLGKLMTLKLIDPQIMMGFGMVTSMLAKPGPTDDSLVSEIEFTDDGKILANGTPLPFGP